MRIVLLLALASCKHDDRPCEHGARVEVRRVDEDSPYMKKLFAHVGMDRTNAATDPAAIEAGIRADVDQWSHDTKTADGLPLERKTYTDYYLTGDRAAIEKYLAALGPEYAPPDDHIIAVGKLDNQWRTYYLGKPLLPDAAIVKTFSGIDPIGRPFTALKLNSMGKVKFREITKATVGHKLATLVDGVVVEAPIIDAELTKADSLPVMAATKADADALAKRICN